MPTAIVQTIKVEKTARYYVLGEAGTQIDEVWIVCHGYGQLASYFINHFATLHAPHRLVVAPEGLSRFYLSDNYERVGASWMTREDRLLEIDDHVAYLNGLYAKLDQQLQQRLSQGSAKLIVLGFSQGTATVWRWIHKVPQIPVHALIVWAGMIPNDVPIRSQSEKLKLCAVLGTQDPFIPAEKIEAFQKTLAELGMPDSYQVIRYDGGHTIDPSALEKVLQWTRKTPGSPENP